MDAKSNKEMSMLLLKHNLEELEEAIEILNEAIKIDSENISIEPSIKALKHVEVYLRYIDSIKDKL